MMRYLVTGATGFVGPHLVRRLRAEGHTCRCLIRSADTGECLKGPGIQLVPGDITEPESLIGLAEGMDRVLHLATLGHMSHDAVTESVFEAVNVQGTINIMRECLRAGVGKVVHCSTVAAVGISRDIPATEESRCHPHHPYGRSKRKAEQEVLRLVSLEDLPAVIVRFSMIYGPGDWRDMLRLTRMAKRGFFPKIGKQSKLTPLIHVDDAIEGLLLAAEKGKTGDLYFITNRQSEPFDKIIRILQRALGIPGIPIYIPGWLALFMAGLVEKAFPLMGKRPPITRKNMESTLADRVFSIDKAEHELGFNPVVDPETGLPETVAWYKKQGWV